MVEQRRGLRQGEAMPWERGSSCVISKTDSGSAGSTLVRSIGVRGMGVGRLEVRDIVVRESHERFGEKKTSGGKVFLFGKNEFFLEAADRKQETRPKWTTGQLLC